jgi:hypothetical protein
MTDEEPASEWDTLLGVGEGDRVEVRVEDFQNTNYPKEENPRTLSGEVTGVNEDVGHSAGEILRTVAVGDPRDEGFYVDLGDTAENQLTGGSSTPRRYSKVWQPRPGKDRLLLGRVAAAEVVEEGT